MRGEDAALGLARARARDSPECFDVYLPLIYETCLLWPRRSGVPSRIFDRFLSFHSLPSSHPRSGEIAVIPACARLLDFTVLCGFVFFFYFFYLFLIFDFFSRRLYYVNCTNEMPGDSPEPVSEL